MTDELKPVNCGCGGRPIIEYGEDGICRVRCSFCLTGTVYHRNKAEAIEAWNRAMGNRMELQTVERTAKVKEGWGLAMCCACEKRVFPCDKYCSHCGCRLIWGDDNE